MRRLLSAVCCSAFVPVAALAVPAAAAPEKIDPFAEIKKSEPASRLLGLKIRPFAKEPQVQNGTASVGNSRTSDQVLLMSPSQPRIWNSGMNSSEGGTR